MIAHKLRIESSMNILVVVYVRFFFRCICLANKTFQGMIVDRSDRKPDD